jgi:hypothetical protein
VENLREELDAPSEWFYDQEAQQLFLFPNGTTAAQLEEGDVTVPLLDSIVRVQGSAGASGGEAGTGAAQYTVGVSFSGFEFTETRATFLEQYEVPSGGDWSIHRGAALFVEDAENITVDKCSFNQTGGNGVFFSNHVTDSVVSSSEFAFLGDSAIASVGRTAGQDGTAPTYPNRNTFRNNHIHDVGVYGKQTSCYFQALSANATLKDNVCYNGPVSDV